jgi:hypothetical protein
MERERERERKRGQAYADFKKSLSLKYENYSSVYFSFYIFLWQTGRQNIMERKRRTERDRERAGIR